MNFFNKMAERFIKANRSLKKWRRVVSVLAAIVVFVTTYAMVLPAITLDKDTASTQSGMEIAASDQEPESDGTVYEAVPEEEPVEASTEDSQEESAAEDSGSQEAEVSEDQFSDEETVDSSQDISSNEEEFAAETGKTVEAPAADRTSESAKTVEEVQLITENTQLYYQYIDESFERNPEDDVDDGYTVYAEFGADAKLPVGVELKVKEITKDSDPEAYEAYYEKALSEMQDKYDENTGLSFAKFYDISFVYNGKEVEPSGYVKVRIEYNKPVEVKTDENIDTVHFDKNNEERPEVIQSEVDTKKQDEEDAIKAVEFESDQFSVYGVVGTNSLIATFVGTDGNTYEVTVTCDADANIPSDAELVVSEVSESSEKYNTYLDRAIEVLGVEADNIAYKKLLNISIVKDGAELTPESPVSVEIRLLDKEDESDKTSLNVIHYEGESENPTVVEDTKEEEGTVKFETEGFSVYGVFYTVDFHWEVDGKEYEYSLAGGSSVSLRELLEVLNIIEGNEQDSSNSVDEKTDSFIDNIESVRFSDESLVKVEKITEGITAGALKEKLELECEYSAELTESQREAMDSKVFYAPDWALISMKAFDTEEYLTVNMKDGEEFQIMVTDAQIKKDYISASGETYTITVTYGAEAGIPDGADLKVEEILPGTEEYVDYLTKSARKLNLVSANMAFARFFDITIVDKDGEKVEPKAPVNVEIAYKDAMEIREDQSLNIVHFAENGTEIISDASVSENGKEITYEQSSFSVTGTIINNNNVGGKEAMILIKDGTRYYIVNNNGSLTEVGYDESTNEVSVTDPMLWTIDNDKGHIYFHSEATGFGTNLIASDYYRRYLDPSSEKGWLEEKSWPKNNAGQYTGSYAPGYVKVHKDGDFQNNGETVEINHVEDRSDALADTALTIGNDGTISQGNYYLAIERDSAGTPVSIKRQEGSSGAAQFVFATASKVPSGLHLDNAVDHIDISIAGDAKVHVPLAYGDYYGPQGAAGGIIKTVTENEKVELGEAQVPDNCKYMLNITSDDMKRATISAHDKDGNELDDVFYVTGFSANTSTDVSTVQVRIEGRFLCADLRGTQYEHVDGGRYDGIFWTWPPQWPDGNYVNAVRQARLNNIVEYNVTVIKPVTFCLVDPEVGQLYDADGNPIMVTVDCAFAGNFNYWDYGHTAKNSGNECPPIQGNAEWRQGDIPNHDMSGMDFVLTGDAENENSPLVAIEITKVIRDEEGKTINVSVPVTNTFDIYQNKTANRNGVADYNVEEYQGENEDLYTDYDFLHSRNITVDERGSAQIYDYNLTDGMYYISERKDTVPETVTDKNGKEYTYVKTYIETEYVRRGDKYDDKTAYPDPMHVSADYTKDDAEYRSSPEVVGYFNTLTGERKKSGFLEYYVYNIYTSGKDLPVEKIWAEGTDVPEGAEVKAELWYKARKIKDNEGNTLETPGEWSEPARVINDQGGFSGIEKTELTLKADPDEEKNWKGHFKNLPNTVTRDDGVYEVDYLAKETAVMINVSGSDVNVIGDYEVTTEIKDGVALITNARKPTRLEVEKKWMQDTTTVMDAPEGAEVTVQLVFASRKIRNADGTAVEPEEEWSDYKEVATVNEQDGSRTFDGLFVADPLLNEDELTTSIVLKTDEVNTSNSWKGAFENLPKTLIDASGNVYEIDYSAKEDKVTIKIPGSDKTYVDEAAKDVTDNFVITVNKTEGSDDESNPTDDKVTITNTKEKVTPKVTKLWQPDPEDDTANAVVELRRYKKKDTSTAATKTEATVQKVWDDAEAPEGTRPESVTVSLYRDDESVPVATATLNEDNNWTATQRGLAKYKLDNEEQETEEEHVYKWLEGSESTEYSASYAYRGNTTVITNTYTPSQINLTVEKIWDDANNQDGKRPENLTVNLMKEGEDTPVVTVSLSEANGWKADSGLVPARETDRTPINYHWEEEDVPDYTPGEIVTSGSVTTLTNSHTPETTEAEIRVVWEEGENVNPPEEGITVTLSNGEEVILNSDNDWHAIREDLPKYYNGTEISYTWSAPDVEGYEEPVVNKEENLTTVTYTPEPEKDTVLVTLFTELRDNLPEDWNVNIYNVTVNGVNITDQLKNVYGNLWMTSYSLRPISFEVPKNSTIGYHYEVSNEIRLNGVASADVTARSFNTDQQSGSRDVKFKVGNRDAKVYNVITDRTVPLNQDIIPDPKYMNLTLHFEKAAGTHSDYFGFSGLSHGVYRDTALNKLFDFQLQPNGSDTYSANNIPVQTDLDDVITYMFESGNYWSLDNRDAIVISSPDSTLVGKLYYDESSAYFSQVISGEYTQDSLGIVAHEGNANIYIRVVPKSSLQSTNPLMSLMSRKGLSLFRNILPSQNEALTEEVDDSKSDNAQTSLTEEHATDKNDSEQAAANNRVMKAPALKANNNSGAPEGYEVDSGFTPIQHTLDKNGWSYTYPDQDKYDEKGNEYIYEIVEISHYPTEYHTESITGDVLSEAGVVITNVKEQKGSISVTKNATGLDAGVTKIYQIGVKDASGKYYNLDGTEAGTVPYYVTFNSNETKTWSNLPEGSYEVVENSEAAGVDGYSLDVSGTGAITVSGGGSASTTVTNTYTKNPGNLELTKKVLGDGADTTKEFDFTIELTAPTGKTLAETYRYTKTGEEGENTLTLNRSDDDTKATVTGISLKADDVYTIIGLPAGTSYKITEADYSSEGYSSSLPAEGQSGTITGGITAKESVEVTNTLGKGNLTVEKIVAGNAADNTKYFDFSVLFEKTGLIGNSGSYKIGTAETIGEAQSNDITFENGSATVTFTLKGGEKAEFTDLPYGTTFTVSETSKDADGYETTVSSTGGTVNDSDKTVTGSISTTAAVTASYTNTKNTTTVEASKEWKAGEQVVNWPEDVDTVEFTLYKTVNEQTTVVSATDVANITNPVEINSSTEGKKAVWSNLPTRYLVEGTWYDATYTVKETKIVYNEKSGKAEAEREVTVDIAATENEQQAQGSHQFTVTNELEPATFHATKEWKNKDGQVLDGTTGKEIPAGAKVTFTLYVGENPVTVTKEEDGQTVTSNRAVELSGTDATSGGTVTPDTDDYEANWIAYFTHLPKYDADGKIIEYTVRETGTWTGYVVDGENTASNDGKITNKEKALTLDILKVEKDKETPLENAVFKLYRINENSETLDKDTTTEQPATTNAKGQTSFSNLTIGYYIVTETNTPEGYVLTGEDSFYIEVTENGINLLTKGEGAPKTWAKNAVSYGNVKTFTTATADKNAQAKVENTPGAVLPAAGGSGTGLFISLGSILMLIAGVLLVMKRSIV